jgi:hypothetical protein
MVWFSLFFPVCDWDQDQRETYSYMKHGDTIFMCACHAETARHWSKIAINIKVYYIALWAINILCNISNPTMMTGLDFKSAQFDQVRRQAKDWIKM